ncbi:hypothetical protein [Microbacterium aurum]|uniref:hypothetical protein n=1 Tax=Microbacterium aurum TaxID=36805 RepID=UPI0028E952B2|nr:hypothetical protein [Microbacterium aurum]
MSTSTFGPARRLIVPGTVAGLACAPGTVSSGFQVFAVSWTGIVLLAVVAGIVVWLVIRRRRARGSRPQVVSANPTPAP